MAGTGNVFFGQMAVSAKSGLIQGTAGVKSIEKASEAFSAVMNQSMNQTPYASQDVASEKPSAEAVESDAAYDKYRYKEYNIEETSKDEIRETIDSGEEELENFEQEVIEAVSEELDVTEEEVMQAMETLQLTPFDLLDSEKLGMLVAELSGLEDNMQLLLNGSFFELKNQIGELADELMQNLDVSLKEFQEIIERLQIPEVVEQQNNPEAAAEHIEMMPEEPSVMPEEPQLAVKPDAAQAEAPDAAESLIAEVVPEEAGNASLQQGVTAETVSETSVPAESVPEVSAEEIPPVQTAEEVPPEETELLKIAEEENLEPAAEEVPEEAGEAFELPQMTAGDAKKSGMQNRQTPMNGNAQPENMPQTQQAVSNENVANTAQTEQSYSFKIETIEIIQKIVQTMKVAVSTAQTTMEMQLNPENLGKLYLEITAREGAVRAQIAAQNEAVQQALEAQIATLRENLEQAGVRVDAIEVTVASHEFEKNLEQNQHHEEEAEGRRQESMKTGRRNLRLDELDELAGLMTEEEQLVAQIMKDNGNSVDLTA